MKISRLTVMILLMGMMAVAFSQSNSDFIIIDEIADDFTRLEAEYANQPNVYFTDGSSPNALEQIHDAIGDMQIEDLHIFVPTKPGAIVFSSIAITSENVMEIPLEVRAWTKYLTGKVILHSEVVFTGEEGLLLKQGLEEITGLVFESVN